MTELRFTETMRGYVGLGEEDCRRGYEQGRRSGTPLFMRLHLVTPDLDAFLRSRDRLLNVHGEISYAPLGERMPASGTVNQLIDVGGDPRRKSMPYRLEFSDADGRQLVLSAIKDVVNEAGFDVWRDTTTLNVRILGEDRSTTIAAGILHISLPAFLRQFPSYRLSGGSVLQRILAFPRFYGAFVAKLWEVYGPRRRATP
jgi:cholesterol oxidase